MEDSGSKGEWELLLTLIVFRYLIICSRYLIICEYKLKGANNGDPCVVTWTLVRDLFVQ